MTIEERLAAIEEKLERVLKVLEQMQPEPFQEYCVAMEHGQTMAITSKAAEDAYLTALAMR